MFLARRHTRHSLEEIGGYFGGRDHTTVMHAVRTVEAKRGLNPEFNKVVATLDSQRLGQLPVHAAVASTPDVLP